MFRRKWRAGFSLTYREILTCERIASRRRLRLHTRTTESVTIRCRGERLIGMEDELRRRGVRIVDEWGAIIAPTLTDFEAELAREPMVVRQSSDNA